LAIKRTILRTADKESMDKLLKKENIKCIAPLDIALKIADLPFKMTREMMCDIAFWGQNQSSYKTATEIIEKVYGIKLSIETVRTITDYVGMLIFEEDTKEANKTYGNTGGIRHAQNKDGVLYIQSDGSTVNTRTKDKEGSSWRENKLGIVFSSDNMRKKLNKKGEVTSRILKKEYTSYIGNVGEFKKYLYAAAIRNGYGKYKETVLISDGAAWIKNIGEELFPDAVQILDLFHLCENVYSYAKAIFKNDEAKYKSWSENIIKMLKDGEKSKVIQILKTLKNRKIPKNTVNLYTYVTNNIGRIDYKEYSEKGYYIGSGAIESGNKVVMQKRLKLAGMRWDELSAQYLLSLRAKYESNLWKDCVIKKLLSHDFKLRITTEN